MILRIRGEVEDGKGNERIGARSGLPRHCVPRNDAYGVYDTKDATFIAFTFFTFIASLRRSEYASDCGNPVETSNTFTPLCVIARDVYERCLWQMKREKTCFASETAKFY